jgi:hypothetical protein
MANLFDPLNYPQQEPMSLTLGDRWAWRRDNLSDYPSNLYTLEYSCRLGSAVASEIKITATANAEGYKIEVPAATTVGYAAGVYQWQAYITRNADGERITIDVGSFEVFDNRDTSTADPRSFNQKMRDTLRALALGKAGKDVSSYSIAGRSLTRFSPEEIQNWLQKYEVKCMKDDRRALAKKGLGNRGRLLTRFK